MPIQQPGIIWRTPFGFSSVAGNISRLIEEARKHSRDTVTQAWRSNLHSQTYEHFTRCNQPGWDGYDAVPISGEAVKSARRFIEMLPDNVQPPDVVPEPTGELSFDWTKGKNLVLSVTASSSYLIFAGIFGNQRSEHGRTRIDDEFPETLSSILTRYFPKV